MPRTIFYSWQSDRPAEVCKDLISAAIGDAIRNLNEDLTLDPAGRFEIDSDTQNLPGSPSVAEALFQKIDQAAIFIPDLTFVGSRIDGRPTPNPNVLVEYGWALKYLTHARIVPVMNGAFGLPHIATIPFDLAHRRFPDTYDCPPDADEVTLASARGELARTLSQRLRDVVRSPEFKAHPNVPAAKHYKERDPLDGKARFRGRGEPIGLTHEPWRHASEGRQVTMAEGPCMWLRVFPIADPERKWRWRSIKDAIGNPGVLHPLGLGRHASFGEIRAEDGYATYWPDGDSQGTHCFAFVFDTGEIWSVDALTLRSSRNPGAIFLSEVEYGARLEEYCGVLGRLGVPGPYRWVAGIEGVRDRALWIPHQPDRMLVYPGPDGICISESIVERGEGDLPLDGRKTLRPFFEWVYDRCGVVRPDWLDAD